MTIYPPFKDYFIFIIQFFLQGESSGLLDYVIIFLGPGLVLFFTFYLLWAGRRKNHKIINVSKDALLEIFSNEFDDLVTDQLSSNGGLLFPKYKKSSNIPFKDFRVVFALEERHLMLSVIISWFSGVNDYIAIEGNAKKGKLPAKIQIIPNHEEGQIKKHQDLLFQLKDIKLNSELLDQFFLIRATSVKMGSFFLIDKPLLKQIYSIRESLVRLSVDSSEDPSIRLYCRINKELDLVKLHKLFLTLTERVNQVADKKVMKR